MQRRPLLSRGERDDELALFHDMLHKKEGERKSNAVHPLMSNGREESSFDSSIKQRMASSTAAAGIVALKSSKPGDDLLTTDLGKNDYDWLLTPPGTPLMAPSDHVSAVYGEEFLSHAVLPNLVRSLAAIKTPRMSSFKSEPMMKNESGNGMISHARPDMGLRSGRISMVRSNSTPGSAFSTNNLATIMTGRRTPAAPSSRPTSRPTTPTKRSTISSMPASRPTTPTSRSRAPATAILRPETPTNRSRTAPGSLSRPSTPSGRGTTTPFSRNPENNMMQSSLTLKGSVPSRPTTPLRRQGTSQVQPQSVSAVATRSSSVAKQRPAPSRSNPSSRGSSPTIKPNAWQQLSDIPGFSLEPPPNLRTSLSSRPSSNSRGASITSRPGMPSTGNVITASVQLHSDMHPEKKAQEVSMRRPSSPVVAKGRSSPFSSLASERQASLGISAVRNNGRLDRGSNESVLRATKSIDRMMPARNPIPSSLSPDKAVSMSQAKPAVRPGTPTTSRDIARYGRVTPRKSSDLSARQMEVRQSATIGVRTSMRNGLTNGLTSSLFTGRPAGLQGLANGSPMATSSNASSDYSMSLVRDPDGSEPGEEFRSEAGSKASPASQSDSISSVVKNAHMSSWLDSPECKDGTPLSISCSTPDANQNSQYIGNGATSDLCITCRHGCVPANCDLCNMKIRLQKLNEKCRASLRASLQVTEELHGEGCLNGSV